MKAITPNRIEYEGYIIKQSDGWAYIYDKKHRELLRVRTARRKTKKELIELLRFNEIYIKGGG